jgi:hypothetical protein
MILVTGASGTNGSEAALFVLACPLSPAAPEPRHERPRISCGGAPHYSGGGMVSYGRFLAGWAVPWWAYTTYLREKHPALD